MTDLGAERERDLERFLTFVDAIVAIAITLLVLPLVDVAGSYRGDSVTTLLHVHTGQIWAFFLSFAVIADLWLTQHRVLRNVVASTPVVLRLLLLWTLTIVVLPFPTALVAGSTGHEGLTKSLYVGTMTLSALVLALLCVEIGRHREVRDSPDVPDATRAFAVVVTFVLALAVMLLVPFFSYWPLLLLLLPQRLIEAWRHRHEPPVVR